MDKNWKFITGFALLGLSMAALSYAYAALHDYTKPMNNRNPEYAHLRNIRGLDGRLTKTKIKLTATASL